MFGALVRGDIRLGGVWNAPVVDRGVGGGHAANLDATVDWLAVDLKVGYRHFVGALAGVGHQTPAYAAQHGAARLAPAQALA